METLIKTHSRGWNQQVTRRKTNITVFPIRDQLVKSASVSLADPIEKWVAFFDIHEISALDLAKQAMFFLLIPTYKLFASRELSYQLNISYYS